MVGRSCCAIFADGMVYWVVRLEGIVANGHQHGAEQFGACALSIIFILFFVLFLVFPRLRHCASAGTPGEQDEICAFVLYLIISDLCIRQSTVCESCLFASRLDSKRLANR